MTAPFQSKLVPHEKEIFDLWYHQRATLKMIQTMTEGILTRERSEVRIF